MSLNVRKSTAAILLVLLVGLLLTEEGETKKIKPRPKPPLERNDTIEVLEAVKKGEYDNLCEQAIQLKFRGLLGQSKAVLVQATQLAPNQPRAWTILAEIESAEGLYSQALLHYLKVAALQADAGTIQYNIGVIYSKLGNLELARIHLERAAQCKDISTDHHMLGLIYAALDRLDESIAHLLTELYTKPDSVATIAQLGKMYKRKGNTVEAQKYLEYAIQLNPSDDASRIALAELLIDTRNFARCEDLLREVIARDPSNADAVNAYGTLEKERGNLLAALQYYERALELNPYRAHYYNNVAVVYEALAVGSRSHLLEDAEQLYRKALELEPGLTTVYSNLGNVLVQLGDPEGALAFYAIAVAREPYNVRYLNLLASCYIHMQRWESALQHYRQLQTIAPDDVSGVVGMMTAARELGNWEELANLQATQLPRVLSHILQHAQVEEKDLVFSPYNALEYPEILPTQFIELVRRYSEFEVRRAAQMFPSRNNSMGEDGKYYVHRLQKPLPKRLRIGYVLNPYNHPWFGGPDGVLIHHDRTRFEVFAYVLGGTPTPEGAGYDAERSFDEQFRRIEEAVEHAIAVDKMTFVEVTERIHEDGIHILVNCDGYMKGGRMSIFAMQPAPIQVHLPGIPSTLGAPYIPYMLTDRVLVPSDVEYLVTEKLVVLPLPPYVAAFPRTETAFRKDQSIGMSEFPKEAFVFACLGRIARIDQEMFNVYLRILQRVPNSYLWLSSLPTARQNLQKYAQSKGVDPSRLVFRDPPQTADKWQALARADLALDTRYSSIHTRLEMLWAGVPTLTMPGLMMHSRIGLTLSNTVCSSCTADLTTHSLQEFEERAVLLANNPLLLNELRWRIELGRLSSVLFRPNSLTIALEVAFEKLVEQHIHRKVKNVEVTIAEVLQRLPVQKVQEVSIASNQLPMWTEEIW